MEINFSMAALALLLAAARCANICNYDGSELRDSADGGKWTRDPYRYHYSRTRHAFELEITNKGAFSNAVTLAGKYSVTDAGYD